MKIRKSPRGRIKDGLIACCLYYSCVHHECIRTPYEICIDLGLVEKEKDIKSLGFNVNSFGINNKEKGGKNSQSTRPNTDAFHKADKMFKGMFENVPIWKDVIVKTVQSDHYLLRYCSKLVEDKLIREDDNINYYKISTRSQKLYDKLKDEIDSCTPKSLAIAIIYYVLHETGIIVSTNDISKSLGICVATLNKVLKQVKEFIN